MIVEAQNIAVIYKRALKRMHITALADFSLVIQDKDIYGILGPNGAGKTTAMHVMLGLLRPDKGKVRVMGQEPYPGSKLFRDVAYVPEEPVYHPYLTVSEAIDYYYRLYHKGYESKKIKELIEFVDLKGFEHLRLQKCSKGMKQKVGLVQCLIGEPKVLFLDEPTRGLDPLTVKKFREVLLELNKKGATIILNSHVLSEIEMMCNRIAILDKGKVAKEGELNDLVRYDVDRYHVEFSTVDAMPDFLEIKCKTDTAVKGEIPVRKFQDFIAFITESKSTLFEITLKKQSLEEYLFNVISAKKNEDT